MIRLAVLGALLPALMCSTAYAADVLQEAVVDDAPEFLITGKVGGIVFDMPDFDTGVFGINDDTLAFGGMVGLSGSGAVSSAGDWDVILGFNVFGAIAGGSTTTAYSDGPGTVYISGLSNPAGTITTDAVPGGAPPDVGTTVNASSATATSGTDTGAGFAAPSGTGFIVGAVSTNDDPAGDTVVTYGAIANTTGGIAVVSGDLDGAISTEVSRQIMYLGADVTLGLGGEIGDGTSAQVYIGPSYRGLFQENTTTVTVNLPESQPVVTLPNFSIATLDDIDSDYLGGVLGGSVAFGAGDGVVFTLGLEGGVYGVRASWTGQDTYETSGGVFDPDGGGPIAFGPQPTLTVQGPTFERDFDDTIAFAARGNAAVTWAVGSNQALSLGGSLEYLSAVATVDHAGRTVVNDGVLTGAYPGTDPAPTTTLRWGSMVNFAITASLTGTF